VLLAAALAGLAYAAHYVPLPPGALAEGQRLLDPVTLAILLGLVAGRIRAPGPRFVPGIRCAARTVLAAGVVLLGSRMDLMALAHVGAKGLALSLGVVAGALLYFAWLRRRIGLERDRALLLGVGTAICGGTAIMAIAPIIRAKQEDTVTAVATVTFVGLVAMVVLPPVAAWLGLSALDFGIWAGLTIHQTPQVIAAGFAHGIEAGQAATVIKLARVSLLAPVALALILFLPTATPGPQGGAWRRAAAHFPLFIIGFVLMALLRTRGLLPEMDLQWARPLAAEPFQLRLSVPAVLAAAATFLLTVSMAAVGLETDVRAVWRAGLKPVLAALGASVLIGGAVLAGLRWL